MKLVQFFCEFQIDQLQDIFHYAAFILGKASGFEGAYYSGIRGKICAYEGMLNVIQAACEENNQDSFELQRMIWNPKDETELLECAKNALEGAVEAAKDQGLDARTCLPLE